MDKQTEDKLNAQIFEFKTIAWKDALEELNAFLELTDIKLFDYYSPYRIGLELLKRNEPFFKLTFFFRLYPPNNGYPSWRVMLSVTLHRGGMEMSGLEKRYSDLDKEITQIKGADIYHMVRNLISTHGTAG